VIASRRKTSRLTKTTGVVAVLPDDYGAPITIEGAGMTTPTRTCPNCGAARPSLGRFCGACGQEYPTPPPATVRAGSSGGIGNVIVWAAGLLVVGVGAYVVLSKPASPASAPAADAPERPTPAPTATPWKLSVTDTNYTSEAGIGDTISTDIEITNSGSKINPGTLINFSELDKYADFYGCKPTCTVEDLPGLGPSGVLPGVAPGKPTTFHIEFVAKAVGVVRWSVCTYDDVSFGEQVWCGDATTAIR
jgi:hypothetical protein